VPTYQYACTECGHEFEQFQSFSDDALSVCPNCGGKLRKVYGSVGVVFKGSGFYRTDSRSSSSDTVAPVKAKAASGEGSKDSGKSSDSSSSSSTSGSKESSSSNGSSSGSSNGSSSAPATPSSSPAAK